MMLATRALWLGVILLAGVRQGAATIFTVDSGQSQITLSGTITGYAFTAQGPGSLTATYEGTLKAAVSGPTIQFTGLSMIAAITNGTWQPKAGGGSGSAPADYGAEATIPLVGTAYGAARNLVLDLTSPVLNLTQTNFDSSQLIISLVTNSSPVLDYRSALQSGSLTLSGEATNSIAGGSFLSTNGNLLRLVIQIKATLAEPDNSVLTLTGEIVATNLLAIPTVPVITHVTDSDGDLVLSVTNASTTSQLLSSTNLTTWMPASATVSSNGGFIIFTTPISGPRTFFRVEK